MSAVAVVVIGRNEGERLRRCLESILPQATNVVYVDSGSTDSSVALARDLGVHVVEVDTAPAFSAGRARNAGMDKAATVAPDAAYVQFVDGDCELSEGWLRDAAAFLDEHPDVSVVCGRLRERHRDGTIYNRLCDMEWNAPAGEAAASGGIAMMRIDAFHAVGGFDPAVIAAEDDELCIRLRLRGGKVWRLERDMAWHDAAMTRLSQWWRRSKRAGHAFAQVNAIHGGPPLHYFGREVRSAVVWGLVLPMVILGAAVVAPWWVPLGLAAVYPLMVAQIAWRLRRRGFTSGDALLYAAHCMAAKAPQVAGIARYRWDRLRRRPARIIEHKQPGAATTSV